jgi:hypothetical protein
LVINRFTKSLSNPNRFLNESLYPSQSVIGALATPVSGPVSMFLLMIPLLAFYYLSAVIALANDKRRERKSKDALDGTDLASDYKPDAVS